MRFRSMVFKACLGVVLGTGSAAHGLFVQFDLSSDYNRDIIFSDLAGDTALSADGDVNALVTLTVATASTDPDPAGLPSSGLIPFGGNAVQLAPYDGDNAVNFTQNGGFSVDAPTPAPFDVLTLHGFATNANADLDITLNYADISVIASVDAFNWFRTPSGATYLIRDMDGYNVGNNTVFDEDGIAIFTINVPVDASRTLVSFDVVQTNQGTNRPIYTNILAATGNQLPEPALGGLVALGGLLLARRRAIA